MQSRKRLHTPIPPKPTNGENSASAKRELINSLEQLRGETRGLPEKSVAPVGTKIAKSMHVGENARLREELRRYKATCELLESEVGRLETRALEAIAEAGRLKRQLSGEGKTCLADSCLASPEISIEEFHSLGKELLATRNEQSLLTKALSDSECEIARLGKTIDLLLRKAQIV